MKRSAAVLSVIAALGVGFGGGYMLRGSSAPAKDVVAAAQPASVISRSVQEEPESTPFVTPSPTATRKAAPTATPRPQSTPSTYIINKNSRVFHRPSCSSVSQMSEKNKVTRTNVYREDLMEDGYQRCTKCKP